jgi:hypothetical protein
VGEVVGQVPGAQDAAAEPGRVITDTRVEVEALRVVPVELPDVVPAALFGAALQPGPDGCIWRTSPTGRQRVTPADLRAMAAGILLLAHIEEYWGAQAEAVAWMVAELQAALPGVSEDDCVRAARQLTVNSEFERCPGGAQSSPLPA